MKFKDGTLAMMDVADLRVRNATSSAAIAGPSRKLSRGFRMIPRRESWANRLGTQELPVAGVDIQDEKILGTFHVATGRDDHLGVRSTRANSKIGRTPRTRTSFCAAQDAGNRSDGRMDAQGRSRKCCSSRVSAD